MSISLNKSAAVLAIFLATLILNGCASLGGASDNSAGESEIRAGVIEQINPATMESSHHAGVGAIVGGLAGAGLGSLIGAGTGRDVAIAAGAIAGAVGGNYVEKKKYDKPQPAQQVIVRLTSGVLVSIVQPINNALQTGLKVYVEGSGTDARVVPAA
jgi:outer membrane lipoprotein SlyB